MKRLKLMIIMAFLISSMALSSAELKNEPKKIELEYQGKKGFWINKVFAVEILIIEQELQTANSLLKVYMDLEKEFQKGIKRYQRQQKAILALSITTSIGFIISFCFFAGVITYIVLYATKL